jgi:hypothetical protein
MRVRDLLSDETKWCQGSYARDGDDCPTPARSPRAVRWCLVGACHKAYQRREQLKASLRKLQARVSGPISAWNDAPARTFAEVRQVIEELDL